MPRRKKILYHSVHEVLEYDDLRVLIRAGFDVFSRIYSNPRGQGNRLRGPLPEAVNEADFEAWRKTRRPGDERGVRWPLEFARRFDAVIVNHDVDAILANLDTFRAAGVAIVRRTIGQTKHAHEAALRPHERHITTVRYSPREQHRDWLPTHAVIRFGKVLDEFPPWIGGGPLVTFMNTVSRPAIRPNAADYARITEGVRAALFGFNNEGFANARGLVEPKRQPRILRRCGAYLYLHSGIASYTLNFMEAMLIGAPIIAPSTRFINRHRPPPDWFPARYEIPDFLRDGAGFLYDDVEDARATVAAATARDLSDVASEARRRAREAFDADRVAAEWKSLIDTIT